MVRSASSRVSNHEARSWGLILRDAACAAPQDEGIEPPLTRRLALEPLGAEQAAIDADVGAFDRHGADGLGVVVRRPDAADDGIAVAGMLHVFQAGEQQRGADAALLHLRIDAGRSEEIAAGDV